MAAEVAGHPELAASPGGVADGHFYDQSPLLLQMGWRPSSGASVDESVRPNATSHRGPNRQEDEDRRKSDDDPRGAGQQESRTHAEREAGRCDDAQVRQTIHLFLGIGERLARSGCDARDLVEDGAAAFDERVGKGGGVRVAVASSASIW